MISYLYQVKWPQICIIKYYVKYFGRFVLSSNGSAIIKVKDIWHPSVKKQCSIGKAPSD